VGLLALAFMMHSVLPAPHDAKTMLESFIRHHEWVNVPVDGRTVPAYLIWPQHAGRPRVVVVSDGRGGASDWERAVGDQIAAEGFIAIVPDAAGAQVVDAARRFAAAFPAADGTSAVLMLDTAASQLRISAEGRDAAFPLTAAEWPSAIGYLVTGDEHAGHMATMLAQQAQAAAPQAAAPRIPFGKPAHLPAGYFTAASTFANSPRRKEWVEIQVGSARLRTLIVYPDGTGPAPVVIAMQHGTGLDPWMRAVADQLAQDGFIAVAPDLWSGLGPNGGGWDAFEFIDDGIRAAAGKLSPEDTMRRYAAARDYALKLPRANGKSASIGFCAGGGNSFRFAGEVPGLNAAVVFYGAAPDEAVMARINAPVLGLYGENDARITSTVEATAAAMTRLGKRFEPHVYAKATHSFALFQDIGGNPAAIEDGWRRAIDFITLHTR
jgi:carboxymethylenebutenolidase